MKSLRESLLDDDLIDKTDKMIKDEIKSFLKENFIGASSCKISRKPNLDGKYEVLSTKSVEVTNKNINSFTNGMFIWTVVDGSFKALYCNSLESLEGAPEKVGGNFNCTDCKSLKSLEGAPKEVGGSFNCTRDSSLKSLEYAPEKVEGSFCCSNCAGKFTEDDVRKISIVKGKIKC